MKLLVSVAGWSVLLTTCMGCHFASPRSAPVETPSSVAAHGHHPMVADQPSVHGMVLFGSQQLFASHIPMFAAPHDWQALFKVQLSHPSQDALAIYLGKGFQNGRQQLVTIKPAPFVLPQLLNGGITSFKGTLFDGSFEEGGAPMLSQVTVTVTKVIKQSQLKVTTPALPQMTFEGLSMDSFLVHSISAPKNFDQIVQVEWKNLESNAPNIALTPSAITFAAQDDVAFRLKQGQEFSLQLLDGAWRAVEGIPTPGPGGAPGPGFIVLSDFYCTPGPDFFGNCANAP